MSVFHNIISYGARTPDNPVFNVITKDGNQIREVSYKQLVDAVIHVHTMLSAFEHQTVAPRYGIVMGNTPEWVACDLALGISGRIEVPVPIIFNAEQAKNLIATVDAVLVDDVGMEILKKWESSWSLEHELQKIYIGEENIFHGNPHSPDLEALEYLMNPAWPLEEECKVIHTSGTTNHPKGVRISEQALNNQIESLKNQMGHREFKRYVSIIPLSLLIEQITAVYLFLSYGGCLTFLEKDVPLLGSGNASPDDFLKFFYYGRPDFVVASPSIVERIHARAEQSNLRDVALYQEIFGTLEAPFIACGNAPIAPQILEDLYQRGLTIYEGYGLSENTSVVTWNSPTNCKFGTVGKPLDHVELKLDADNELLVKSGSLYLGYTTTDPSSCPIDAEGWLHTGDIASIDNEGYVRIRGRKKHVLITSNGRNISPEWAESQYKRLPFVRNMAVFGNDLPYLVAVFIVDKGALTLQELESAIVQFGEESCGDIERIRRFVLLEATTEVTGQFLTITGDPIRPRLWQRFLEEHPLNSLSSEAPETAITV